MGKKTLIGIGVCIFCLGCVGVYNAIRSYGQAPVEKSDLTATGTVTSVEGEELQLRLTGTAIDSSFKMKYSFVATNGKKYHGEETIQRAQFDSLRKGSKVTVQYHSHNPRISAAKGYGTYYPVSTFPSHDPKTRLLVCSGIAGFGALVILASFFCKEEEENERSGDQQFEQPAKAGKFSDNPLEAVQKWRQEQLAR